VSRTKTWTLTDVVNDVWLDSFSVGNDSLRLATPHDWSIRKRTLRGGLRDGIDLIEVHNGALSYSVLPTRGMGLWRGEYRGNYLGWRSPVSGPVHPHFVDLGGRGGIGWLTGFDEWLCRCGLFSNGPPGEDAVTDKTGRTNQTRLTLHGRIANLPAQLVEVRVSLDPPYELSVSGEVEEAGLFWPQLRLVSTYTTVPGSNRIVVHDIVENRGGVSTEMQMLYHLNIGPPFLEAGSRVVAPARSIAPFTPRAAEGIDTFDTYAGPKSGFTEQVYVYDLLADSSGRTLAMLYNATADRGMALRMNRQELPCFTVWKNTAAVEDGYVTGLEPGTNYPNFKSFERQRGRVKLLPPGSRWTCTWSLEVLDSAASVSAILAEIVALQTQSRAVIHRTPQPEYSPV
jgi:galactose mutarotase-like enzyme